MDVGSEKVFVNNPVLLIPDSLPPLNAVGELKVSRVGKPGVVKLMAAEG